MIKEGKQPQRKEERESSTLSWGKCFGRGKRLRDKRGKSVPWADAGGSGYAPAAYRVIALGEPSSVEKSTNRGREWGLIFPENLEREGRSSSL